MLISSLCIVYKMSKPHTLPESMCHYYLSIWRKLQPSLRTFFLTSVPHSAHAWRVVQRKELGGDPPLLAQAIHFRLSAKAASRPMRYVKMRTWKKTNTRVSDICFPPSCTNHMHASRTCGSPLYAPRFPSAGTYLRHLKYSKLEIYSELGPLIFSAIWHWW